MALTAIPVGFVAGLFGIGGGLITVPFLYFIFQSLWKSNKRQNSGIAAGWQLLAFSANAHLNFEAQILTSCGGYTSAAPFSFVERKRQTFQCSTNGDLPKQKKKVCRIFLRMFGNPRRVERWNFIKTKLCFTEI